MFCLTALSDRHTALSTHQSEADSHIGGYIPFVPFTVRTDVVLLRAGSPGQFMMYPGGPRPQFVNAMPAFGHVVAYPGGPPGSPGGPPPAGAPSTCHKLIVQFWHGMRCW